MADMYMSNTRGRGSWSRGGRVGYWRGGQREVGQGTKRQPKPVEEAPALPCGSLLETISLDSIISESHLGYGSPAITDCRAVASYNWTAKQEATILVPGMPPKWTPLSPPPQLKEDSGTYYRDPNAFRFPEHPMEPAVEAIMRSSRDDGSGDWHDSAIDIFACGSTLGNLFRFANGDDSGFRMLVEVIGSTVHLIRREKAADEKIQGVYGYGHAFPEAYTTWDSSVRGSEAHERIIRYKFGGFHCLVRFKGDGYLPEKVPRSQSDETKGGGVPDIDTLTSELAGHSISTAAPSDPGEPTESGLRIDPVGKLIPQEAVFDLKTRTFWKGQNAKAISDLMEAELPRLWVKQIPNFLVGYHSRGVFSNIQINDVRPGIAKWESDKKETLQHLAALLRRIVGIARERHDGKFEIARDRGEDVIRILEQTPDIPSAFSEDAAGRWEIWLNGSTPDHQAPGLKHPGYVWGSDGDSSSWHNPSDDEYDAAWSDDGSKDLTACDKECGYCGRCKY